jgi:membrane-bound metal-dependent hydrolase YbcI (DUF457 family)
MIVGHLAIAHLAKQTVFQKHNFAFLVTASLAPDIVDKPASILFGYSGRGIGHSLLVFAFAAALAWLLAPKLKVRKDLILAGMVMWLSHLVGDFLEWHILLWPFLDGQPKHRPKFNLWDKLYDFYVSRLYPEQLWFEIVCITATLMVVAIQVLLPRLPTAIPYLNWARRRQR